MQADLTFGSPLMADAAQIKAPHHKPVASGHKGPQRLPRRAALLLALLAAHLGGLWWMSAGSAPTPLLTEPAVLTGVLVSAPSARVPDAPRPSVPPALPAAAPAAKAAPQVPQAKATTPPLPKAEASERAVTTPAATAAAAPAEAKPSPAVAPAAPSAHAAAAPPGPAAAPATPANEGPVVPPSAEASYLNNPEPVYPRASRRLHQEGRVLLSVHVLQTGAVGDIQLKRSSGFPLLDDAALTAVRAWRFVPAKRAGEPVAYWYVLPIDFSLDR